MTKSEARMTNQTASPNDESAPARPQPARRFVIVVSVFIRHSDFGLRHCSA